MTDASPPELDRIIHMAGRYRLRTEEGTLIVADFDRHTVFRIPGAFANPWPMGWTTFTNGYAVVGERSEWQVGGVGDRYISTPVVSIERFPHSLDKPAQRELYEVIRQRMTSGLMEERGWNLIENAQHFVPDSLIEGLAERTLRNMRRYSERMWTQGISIVDRSIDAILIWQLTDRSSDAELLEWRYTGPHANPGPLPTPLDSVDPDASDELSRWYRVVTVDGAVLRFHPATSKVRVVVDPEWGRLLGTGGTVKHVDQIAVGKPTTWVLTNALWTTGPIAFIDAITGPTSD